MELFSEIYGCYYKIVAEILKRAGKDSISKQKILDITEQFGFAESVLTVPDKIFSSQWNLLTKTETNTFVSRLKHDPQIPLTMLQKRWIKSLLSDRRIRLFLDDAALTEISEALSDVEPLWSEELFLHYDRFENGDDFSSQEYQQNFRLIMDAIRKKEVIRFDYTSAKGKRTRKTCLPLKIEYSPKNDRFRLIALRCPFGRRKAMDRYRFDGIRNAGISDSYQNTKRNGNMIHDSIKKAASLTLDTLTRQSYDTEPVRLLIHNRRNALERAMLHFANYDKDTRQLDENTWECLIYYDSSMETELLIEILSFGPVVQVTGPDTFVELIRERLKRQLREAFPPQKLSPFAAK